MECTQQSLAHSLWDYRIVAVGGRVYELHQTSCKESNPAQQNLLNIKQGGGQQVVHNKIQALCDHASIHNLNQIDNMIPTIHASIPYQHLNHLLAAAVEYCWY